MDATNKLNAEALAVLDLMLVGCREPRFGDYQNGDGETIGPRMDALHEALRAAATQPQAVECGIMVQLNEDGSSTQYINAKAIDADPFEVVERVEKIIGNDDFNRAHARDLVAAFRTVLATQPQSAMLEAVAEVKETVEGKFWVQWYALPMKAMKLYAAAPPSPQPVAESMALDALRAVCRLLDGGQPKDAAGALMVAQSALSGKPAAWSYDMTPPQGFLDYVRANYNGVIDVHAPDWHAKRLWNAAMRTTPAAALQPVAGLTDAGIRQIATEAYRAGELSWSGFDMSSDTETYSIPMLSICHYQLAYAIERHLTGHAGDQKGGAA